MQLMIKAMYKTQKRLEIEHIKMSGHKKGDNISAASHLFSLSSATASTLRSSCPSFGLSWADTFTFTWVMMRRTFGDEFNHWVQLYPQHCSH